MSVEFVIDHALLLLADSDLRTASLLRSWLQRDLAASELRADAGRLLGRDVLDELRTRPGSMTLDDAVAITMDALDRFIEA